MKDILQDMKCKLISIQKKKLQQADFYIFANNYLPIHIWNPPTVLHISRINYHFCCYIDFEYIFEMHAEFGTAY